MIDFWGLSRLKSLWRAWRLQDVSVSRSLRHGHGHGHRWQSGIIKSVPVRSLRSPGPPSLTVEWRRCLIRSVAKGAERLWLHRRTMSPAGREQRVLDTYQTQHIVRWGRQSQSVVPCSSTLSWLRALTPFHRCVFFFFFFFEVGVGWPCCCPIIVWESIRKRAHTQLVGEHSVTVVSALWVTVDWSWPKEWN